MNGPEGTPNYSRRAVTTATTAPVSNAAGVADATFRRALGGIMAVGLAIRLAFVLVVQSRVDELSGDAEWYHLQARLVAQGQGFLHPFLYYDEGWRVPGADHPPGFVVLLAALDRLGIDTPQGQRVVMCLLGTVSIMVIGLLGRRLGGSRIGLIAAALAAIYPNIWINDGMLLTETVFILVTAIALLFTYRYYASQGRGDVLVLSVALTAAMLVRPESALMFVVLLVPLVATRVSLSARERVVQLGAAALVPIVCLAPWVAYNLSRFDEPVLLSNGLGQTLLAGNCDATYSGDKLGFWDFSCIPSEVDLSGERPDLSGLDATYRDRALDYMSEHSDALPRVVAARVLRLWGVFRPNQSVGLDGMVEGRAGGEPGHGLRIALEAMWAYFVLLPAAVAGAFLLARRRVQILPLFAQALIVTIVAAGTFGLTRYRAGVEVSIVVLAAVTLGWLWSWLTGVSDDDVVIGPIGPIGPQELDGPTPDESEAVHDDDRLV